MIDHWTTEVGSTQDYYPFGMAMPGRTLYPGNYRYGFNGKENDNEVKGTANQEDYGQRIYDNRAARFLSIDPLAKKYPELTPFQYASNRPIEATRSFFKLLGTSIPDKARQREFNT